nr:Na+/H+ antiporter subunit E [uncultured Pseudoxanthomonas sp.]
MTRLRKLMPEPLLSAVLLVLWLLLARSGSLGQVLVGAVLALAVPIIAASFRPPVVHVRRPRAIFRFVLLVLGDVLLSNLAVGRGVLLWRWRQPRSAFVVVPLDLRDPLGLAALSLVTTIVPGTVWSEIAVDGSSLLLHVWDVPDEGAFVARFKDRYERPLREIFE